MRVLVTGGAGFLGSHVVDLLITQGHEVSILDDLSSGSIENVDPAVRFVQDDVCCDLGNEFSLFRPEVVVHLAAQVSVPRSLSNPARDLLVNALGTVNVMEAAAKYSTRKVITVSSAAVYGVPELLPITEGATRRAASPYGASKMAAEEYTKLLGDTRGVGYTIIRPANIYGPRQRTEGDGAVIPTFLERFLSGHPAVIHGDGSQSRDFVYVTDMARAICNAIHHADSLTLNVSTGERTTIHDLWCLMAGLVGWKRPPVFGPRRDGDIAHSVLSNEAAIRHLNWMPLVSLEQGLAETLHWWTWQNVAAARNQAGTPNL